MDENTAWVFVPTRAVLGSSEQIFTEMRRLTDGQLALMAYTSLPALVEACGEKQSWASFPADWLPRMQQDCHFDTVALDLPIPPQLRGNEENDKPGDWNE